MAIKIFKARKGDTTEYIGTATQLSRRLSVSRQAIYMAMDEERKCKGFTISFHKYSEVRQLRTRTELLNISVDLLEEAKQYVPKELQENIAEFLATKAKRTKG